MAFPDWGGVLGAGLADAVSGYQKAVLELPKLRDEREEFEQKRQLRPLERDLAQVKVEQARQNLTAPKPHGLHGGYTTWNPETKQWDVHESAPRTPNPTRIDRIVAYIQRGQQPDASPQEQELSRVLLEDLQARAKAGEDLSDYRNRIAGIREDDQDLKWKRLQYQIPLMQAQAAAQRSRVEQVRDMAQHHRDQAELYKAQAEHFKTSDAIRAGEFTIRALHEENRAKEVERRLEQQERQLEAYERNIESMISFRDDTTDTRNRGLDLKTEDAVLKREAQHGKFALLQEHLRQLKLKGKTLPAKLQAELTFLQEKAEQAKMKGETLPAMLEARLEKLVEDIAGAEGKRRLAEATEPAKVGKALADAATAREKLAQLEANGAVLPEKLQAELQFLKERAEQATTKGETWGDYLQKRLDKLEQDIASSDNRDRRAEDLHPTKKSSAEVTLEKQRESLAKLKREAEANPTNTRLQLSIKRLEQVIKYSESREQRAVAAAKRAEQRAKDAAQPQTKIQSTPGGTTTTYELKTTADFATFEQAKRELTPLLKKLPQASQLITSKSPRDEAIYRMAWQSLGGATLPATLPKTPATSTPTTPPPGPVPTGMQAPGISPQTKAKLEKFMELPQSEVDAEFKQWGDQLSEMEFNAFRDAYQRKFGTDPPIRMP